VTTTRYDVVNPATEQVIGPVDFLGQEETDAAIDVARKAFGSWSSSAPADRARLLRRFAEVVDRELEQLACLEVANAGHTITNARAEAANVRDVLDYFSAAPERLSGRQIPVAGGVDITFKEPLGVVGVIVPWNFPMPIAAWAFAPALAAGNTVVVKPAELTPFTALRLAELAIDAGLPEGVLQVLPGQGSVVGERFVTNPVVRKVVFTGSSDVGKRVMAGCAGQVKRITLELGGKSANIVFADSDVERAAATAPYAAFDNAGQDCCARSRVLVERSVYDEFLELLGKTVGAMRVGDPTDEQTEMGPLISAEHRDHVASYVGPDAHVAFRGICPTGPGYWYPPTVISGVEPTSRLAREEVFGPVLAVMSFKDEADAIRIANESSYGLSGSIWTENLGRAFRVARAVESGNLSVNSHVSVRYSTPFGGFKHSGLGRELGPDATDAFTEVKNVFIATGKRA
jgi:acyl-CoA reductase-like NAD-dependent aldehyde dehydrogenase